MEARRLRAAELLEAGWSVARVAAELGVAASTVFGWQRRWREGGSEALRSTGARGRQCRLSPAQLAELERELLRGPRAHGYATDLWTLRRIAEVIWRLFGVRYGVSAVWRLLGAMNWSRQKPTRRAKERDEERIAAWRAREWPKVKRGR